MSGFWKMWLTLWCLGVALFGIVLAGAAFAATDGAARTVYALIGGAGAFHPDATTRFSVAVLGAVSIGWAVTMIAVVRIAGDLGAAARPLWLGLIAGVTAWFVIDTPLSIATGFALNAIPNVILWGGLVFAILASGVLRRVDG